MTESKVIYEEKENFAIITMNRPEAMNAINVKLNDDLHDALLKFQEDDNLKVLILTGTGRSFSAGLDLKDIEKNRTLLDSKKSCFGMLRQLKKPVIAAVNGFAITGGFELVLSCDIILASETASFADTHARVGVIPGGGLSQILPRIVGVTKAKEISFSGNFITAQEAYRIGLVNHVYAPDELLKEAEKLALDIISAHQPTVVKLKGVIDKGMALPQEEAMRLEQDVHQEHLKGLEYEKVGQRRLEMQERARKQMKK